MICQKCRNVLSVPSNFATFRQNVIMSWHMISPGGKQGSGGSVSGASAVVMGLERVALTPVSIHGDVFVHVLASYGAVVEEVGEHGHDEPVGEDIAHGAGEDVVLDEGHDAAADNEHHEDA